MRAQRHGPRQQAGVPVARLRQSQSERRDVRPRDQTAKIVQSSHRDVVLFPHYQDGPQPSPTAQFTPPPPPARPAAAPSAGPGEFTSLFQAPPPPPQAPAMPAAPSPTAQFTPPQPPASPSAAPAAEPGSFTRMFQSPVAPPAPEPLRTPPAAAGPDEFTRMFQSPMPDVPGQGDWPAPAST